MNKIGEVLEGLNDELNPLQQGIAISTAMAAGTAAMVGLSIFVEKFNNFITHSESGEPIPLPILVRVTEIASGTIFVGTTFLLGFTGAVKAIRAFNRSPSD